MPRGSYGLLGYNGIDGDRADRVIEAMKAILDESSLKQESDLDRISRAVASIDGIVLCILFGSRARGDSDAYSDYDLLIVFETKDKMTKNLDKLYRATSDTGLFIQTMPLALEEIQRLRPDFVRTVFREGIVIFQRYPFSSPALNVSSKPMTIIEYKLDKLSQKDKLRLEYKLFGRRRSGLIFDMGGFKVGRGAMIVPHQVVEKVLNVLRDFGAAYEVHDILMPAG